MNTLRSKYAIEMLSDDPFRSASVCHGLDFIRFRDLLLIIIFYEEVRAAIGNRDFVRSLRARREQGQAASSRPSFTLHRIQGH